jgi:hypothetical protein
MRLQCPDRINGASLAILSVVPVGWRFRPDIIGRWLNTPDWLQL